MEVAHFKPSSPSHLGKQWPNLHFAPRLLHFSQALEGHSMAGRGLHRLHSWTDFLCLQIQQSLCLTLQEYWIQWSPVIRHVSPCILLWGSISHFFQSADEACYWLRHAPHSGGVCMYKTSRSAYINRGSHVPRPSRHPVFNMVGRPGNEATIALWLFNNYQAMCTNSWLLEQPCLQPPSTYQLLFLPL